MPDTPYVAPAYALSDTDVKSVIKESLDRAILTRQGILAKPKPSYDLDGQKFEWAQYLKQLDATIKQLTEELQTLDSDSPFEIESQAYSL